MEKRHKELIIRGKKYSPEELSIICNDTIHFKLKPVWERTLFQFLQEWFSARPDISTKTSGSTGYPRIIRVSKEKMISSARLTLQYFNLKEKDKALLCLPVDFIAGKMMVVRSLVAGLNLYPVEPKGNPLPGKSEKYDFAAMTPMQVYNILRSENGILKLNNIKKLIVGGGEVYPDLLQKIKQLSNQVFHTYGMTETITHVAVRRINGPASMESYKALPGVTFETDDRGCLVIGAIHLGGEKIITNDLVELISETEFIFSGRFDNVINSGGIKVSPEKIEMLLAPFLQKRFIVGGIPDERLGNKLVIIVESENPDELHLENILGQVNLDNFEKPKMLVTIPRFPETPSGKIIRKKILKQIIRTL
ncbi:MAG: AMP-binding protein [Bacteroidales bacterium]|nr:AMP-binding protein [Bacteroidales bacterium]